MAISDRITSIEEHIKESYQELEGLGIDTTGVNNNLENIPKLIDGYWETLPKVTGEGTSITLDNTKEGKMKIVLKGNTSQEGTPTPETPQDIHVVSGDNTINVCGKNLFDKSKAILNKGVSTSTGGLYNSDINFSTDYIEVETNGIYYTASGVSSVANKVYGAQYDSNKQYIGGISTNAGVKTFYISNANTKYIRLTGLLEEIDTYQLEYGSSATTYEEYKGVSYPINLPIENLINPSLLTTSGSYNVSSINNGEVVGTSITGYAGVRIALGQNVSLKTNDVIYVRLKMKSDVAGDTFNTIQLFNSSNTSITSTDVKLSIPTLTTEYQEYIIKFTLGTNDTLNKLFIQHKGSTSNVFTIKDIQVSYINGSYTPYGTTPIELCKIGDYQDSIVKDNGKWYLNKQIGKVVLNGSENWSKSSSSTNDIFVGNNVLSNNASLTNRASSLSNYFTYNQSITITNKFYITDNKKTIAIVFTAYGNTTLEQFISWLSTHNTIVYYILETPTTTEITDSTLISQLNALAKSYASQTNISQENNDLASLLNATALEEME